MDDAPLIDKFEEIRRAGLYLGPILLAAVAANSIYRVACEGRGFTLDSPTMHGMLWNVMFLAGSAYMAWRLRESFGRAAFAALAIQQALLIAATVALLSLNRLVIGSLSVVFAVLFTISGSRYGRPRRFVPAIAVFVSMFALSWVARSYANRVIGGHSVFRVSP